ncbi:MAG: hypothetical protein WD207_03315 [Xanthobacteraceae bacterium]
MKKVIGATLAGALALGAVVTSTSAHAVCYGYCPPPPPKVVVNGSSGFPIVVGCVMGSAFGLIAASIRKGGGLKLMSQKEFETTPRDKSKELTNEQALRIMVTCGLAAFLVGPATAAPKVVKAKF